RKQQQGHSICLIGVSFFGALKSWKLKDPPAEICWRNDRFYMCFSPPFCSHDEPPPLPEAYLLMFWSKDEWNIDSAWEYESSCLRGIRDLKSKLPEPADGSEPVAPDYNCIRYMPKPEHR